MLLYSLYNGCSITCRKENKKGETNDEEEGNAGKEDNVRKDIELVVFLVSILQWIFYLSFSFFVEDKCKK